MTASHSHNPKLASALQRSVRGRVIDPAHRDYEAARSVFIGGIDKRPSAIVRVADAGDVATVVSHAREAGIELAIKGGGHSLSGHGTTEGGLVIDLADMKDVQIDAVNRTAWAQTGLTTGEYSRATAEYGLNTGFGDTASIGIGGITLAGGIGFLVRKHGLTIDNLLGAEVVTADGDLVATDENTHPDLFWAIRGGGGNFGVATRLRYRLHVVDQIVGGLLVQPAHPDVIASFLATAESASNDLSTIVTIMAAPPLPSIPPEYHGQVVLMALMAHAGTTEEGEKEIESFRALASPIADTLGPMPYPHIIQVPSEGQHPMGPSRTLFVDAVDMAGIESIVDGVTHRVANRSLVQMRVLGGAVSEVAADATAFAHRDRRFMVNVAALVQDSKEIEPARQWVDGLAATLRRGAPAAYTGFLDRPEGVREAYPAATWERLRRVKAEFDPANLFRLNHNIPPAI